MAPTGMYPAQRQEGHPPGAGAAGQGALSGDGGVEQALSGGQITACFRDLGPEHIDFHGSIPRCLEIGIEERPCLPECRLRALEHGGGGPELFLVAQLEGQVHAQKGDHIRSPLLGLQQGLAILLLGERMLAALIVPAR